MLSSTSVIAESNDRTDNRGNGDTTAKLDQTRHKKGRRAKPRNGFYILICGGFENKLL